MDDQENIHEDQDSEQNLPDRRQSRILRSLRSLLRSVSEVSDPFEVDIPVSNEMSSSEDEYDQENRLFDEYLQNTDEPTETFNTELPLQHSYLGRMNSVQGLTVFEPNSIHKIQIFEHHSFVFPGETLPMISSESLFDYNSETNEGVIFGLVFMIAPTFETKMGVTCQVYEKGVDAHGNLTLKSRAQQRFIVLKQYAPEAPYYRRRNYADVKIQPEIELRDPFNPMISSSLKPFKHSKTQREKIHLIAAATTAWPKFVWVQMDIQKIIEKINKFLAMLKIETAPSDLTKLSFWLIRQIPVTDEKKYELFFTNNVMQRLLKISQTINTMFTILCKRCSCQLASYGEVFAMSKQGVQTSYCNPSGYIHETLTVYKMIEGSSYLVDRPSTEFSWFPGYSWQILLCNNCQVHIGWKFIALKKNLAPRSFFGLSGKSLVIEKAKIASTDGGSTENEIQDVSESFE